MCKNSVEQERKHVTIWRMRIACYKPNSPNIHPEYVILEIPAFYEIMCKNSVEQERIHVTIWRMRIACYKPNSPNIHPEYVILIALQQ